MAKILIIDDKENVRRTASDVLRLEGHTVHKASTVEDGIHALQTAKRNRQPYEIALIDLRFDNYEASAVEQGVAGLKVLDVALEDPFLEPVIMTAFPSIYTAQTAVAKGVFRYLVKGDGETIPTDELIRVVELATENREIIRSLHEAIGELRSVLGKDPSDESRLYAEICLKCAEEAYHRLLRARGRKI